MPSPTTSSATNQNVPASLDPNVNALLEGVKWDAGPAGTGAALTYSFPWVDGDVRLQASATSPEAVVNLLYANVVGSAPTAADAQPYVSMLQRGEATAASLGVMASETGHNLVNIGFTGLMQAGLAYV